MLDIKKIKKTCSDLLAILPLKQKEVILRRFALSVPRSGRQARIERETLESIGKDLGITRERVRQIERDGFLKLIPAIKKHKDIFQYFKDVLKKTGGLRREDNLLSELGKGQAPNEIYFLLALSRDFKRVGETKDFYSLWFTEKKSWECARKIIQSVFEKFQETKQVLKIEELSKLISLRQETLAFYLEFSKKIQKNKEGFWGLKDWPEINPRKIKDKAWLALRKSEKPLHFSQVAGLIDSALPETVHNELIKDQRFILVGRGTYALREWGYQDGLVKDVIAQILREAKQPLKKEDILEKTLKQRLVKENTVFLNLSNKKYFLKTPDGYYTIRED